jgi:predicted DNA-binding ribbon-helix-helix protein
MKAKDLKRSLTIAGHRTSLSLEAEFWQSLQEVARAEGKPVANLIREIDARRGDRNLSSAVRVWLLNRLRGNRI